jgi:hypothetical protein
VHTDAKGIEGIRWCSSADLVNHYLNNIEIETEAETPNTIISNVPAAEASTYNKSTTSNNEQSNSNNASNDTHISQPTIDWVINIRIHWI